VREIEVLDGGDAHRLRDLGFFISGQGRAGAVAGFGLRVDDRPGPLDGFAEQILELDRPTFPRFEGRAGGVEHAAEREMLQAHLRARPAGVAQHGEEHLEMLLLRHADHVDQPGRFLVAQALAGGGQVGGGIEETAV
jgi:hypothetical protein